MPTDYGAWATGGMVLPPRTDWCGPFRLDRIYEGDCLKMLRYMPSDCIDLVVTSPPYDGLRVYEGYSFDFEGIARELARVIRPGGVIVWVVGDQSVDGSETGNSFRQALFFMSCGLRLHDTMIWRTDKIPHGQNHRRYQQCFEYMFVLSKGRPATFNAIRARTKYPGSKHKGTSRRPNGRREAWGQEVGTTKVKENIWFYPSGYQKTTNDLEAHDVHPAMFPERLARDHILTWSNPGDLVLDPFMGSGTTAKQAFLLGRRYLGYDVSLKYVKYARERLARTMMQPPLFAQSLEEDAA